MSARGRRIAAAALAVFLVAVAVLVLWPQHPQVQGVFRVLDRMLAPFVRDGLPARVLGNGALEFAGNIAMFVPLGFLGTLALPRRLWWIAPLACLALSCGIETTQLLFLPGRTFSVRDIVGNTTGGLLGTAVAVAVQAGVSWASSRYASGATRRT
jgi:glycopeptide antibiotics resistance protein